ncbi:MAG: hypothetical protein MPJ24_08115 [Pirellulaceae bacterium]|nr:hypothetical protein [Pirellulaceae bacterium]
MPKTIFLAGIMQGSHKGTALHQQDYRCDLTSHLSNAFPDAKIYDPFADHQDSVAYDLQTGREVFFRHNQMCRKVDLLVAYVPEASMGTAIEIWEAYRHHQFVVTISPLRHNWTVCHCSHLCYPTWQSFSNGLTSGEIAREYAAYRQQQSDSSPL